MLKDLLTSLKNNRNSYNSNQLINLGLNYLIENSNVYLIYSVKFKVNIDEFKEFIKYYLDKINVLQNNNDFYNRTIETCYEWYCYFLDNNSLVKSTSSLKSDLKRLYKKYLNSINGFDRFFETIYNAFQEAYNVYDVVFYDALAIKNNKEFKPDRNSCFLTDRKDNLQAIKQANTYYVMIYKNKIPVTRMWILCDEEFEYIVIFNVYGFHFQHLEKFFSNPNQNELQYGDYKQLGKWINVFVNKDIVLVNTDNYERFVYDLYCPYCYSPIRSNQMCSIYIENDYVEEKGYRLQCIHCGNIVYSSIYQEYIDADEAEYSDYYETYIYFDDAVYSKYLACYIYIPESEKVWNIKINDWDRVPKEMAVISNIKDDNGNYIYIIKDQAIYSDYYKAYIPNNENAVYSKQVKSYIDKRDENFLNVNGNYVVKK